MADKGEIWPPAPEYRTETNDPPPPRKQNHGWAATAGALFVTFIAFFMGLSAGGHKDFSESLLSNIGIALFDAALWVLAILYWLDVARAYWKTLKQKPMLLKYMCFTVFFGVLTVLYGVGACISLFLLVVRAAAYDTTL